MATDAQSTDVGLELAPPAAEVPPHLFIDNVEVSWFSLDWNSESFTRAISPDIAGVTSHQVSIRPLLAALSPAASPLAFEVLIYEGTVETPEPTSEPYLVIDCLAPEDPCRWTTERDAVTFSVDGVRAGPQVVVVQSRFFAPPESNPKRISNEATWVFELN